MKQMFIHVNREFSSWLMAMKAWGKAPEKFTGKPNMPYYSKKYFQTKFPKESISFTKEKGKAVLSMTNIVLDLPDFIGKDNICEVLISPEGNGFDIITSYKINDDVIRSIVKESKNFSFKKVKNEETDEIIVTNKDFKDSALKVAGCDIGLNNLMALASNDKSIPDLLVNGRELKSVNQYYNKVKAQKTSELPKGLYSSKAIRKLTETRNHKINSMCHEATKKVVDFLIQYNVNCLVVGNNKGWKQEINIGKRNNQNFVSLPFAKVRNMLRYKCHLNGIIYLETEESYTSKCSFTDRESMSHKDDYKGKRMTRSLFKDSKGHIFNADIHGALNIIRKVFGYDVFKDDLISYVKKKIVKLSRYADLIKSSYIKEKSVNPVLG
jgi:putative transposase